jgi:hypothetical protein
VSGAIVRSQSVKVAVRLVAGSLSIIVLMPMERLAFDQKHVASLAADHLDGHAGGADANEEC